MTLTRSATVRAEVAMSSNSPRERATVRTETSVREAPSPASGHALGHAADVGDDLARGARGFGGLLGQLAHLVGDDREAAAALAGARGLDGRVQRQQVRLLGDRGDRADEAGDLGGAADQGARRPR